jgi:enamine deaminase RidA (YjgF/YER057c/UK114 family)
LSGAAKSVVAPDLEFGYSQAVVIAPGAKTIYIAGQTGLTPDGPDDFESQVDRAFEALSSALRAAGGRAEDVVRITLYVKHLDRSKLECLKRKRRAFFGAEPPASTMIPVGSWPTEALEFEIDAIAAVAGA